MKITSISILIVLLLTSCIYPGKSSPACSTLDHEAEVICRLEKIQRAQRAQRQDEFMNDTSMGDWGNKQERRREQEDREWDAHLESGRSCDFIDMCRR